MSGTRHVTVLALPGPWANDVNRGCYGLPVETWFPERGQGGNETSQRARAICRYCCVKTECLDYAMSAGPALAGIWGGTTETQRTLMRRKAAKEAAA